MFSPCLSASVVKMLWFFPAFFLIYRHIVDIIYFYGALPFFAKEPHG
jgi:hypothetical protein